MSGGPILVGIVALAVIGSTVEWVAGYVRDKVKR